MYQLAICELAHPCIHGTHLKNTDNFLISWMLSPLEFFDNSFKKIIETMEEAYTLATTIPSQDSSREYGILMMHPHPIIGNYWKIIKQGHLWSPQIVLYKQLASGEDVALLKTCWLRIFQRKCRNILRDKKKANIHRRVFWYRSIHGRFPYLR